MQDIRYDLKEIVTQYVTYNELNRDENEALRWCYTDQAGNPTQDGQLLYRAVISLWRYIDNITADIDFPICRCILTSDERSILLTGSY